MVNQTAVGSAVQLSQAAHTLLPSGQIGSLNALPNKVWLVVPDYGSEGLQEPVAAYRTKLDADRAMELLKHAHQSFRLVELPIW